MKWSSLLYTALIMRINVYVWYYYLRPGRLMCLFIYLCCPSVDKKVSETNRGIFMKFVPETAIYRPKDELHSTVLVMIRIRWSNILAWIGTSGSEILSDISQKLLSSWSVMKFQPGLDHVPNLWKFPMKCVGGDPRSGSLVRIQHPENQNYQVTFLGN